MILGVIISAIVGQQRSAAAIAQWVAEHRAPLLAAFRPARQRFRSEATLRRALRHVNLAPSNTTSGPCRRGRLTHPHPPPRAVTGYAVDGKYVRGAGTHGHPTLLVSLVHHNSPQVLGQRAVPDKQHESRGIAQLLAERTLQGMVTSLDAGLTHPALATQILEQGGHYFMVVKQNQARLYQALTWYFDTLPLPCDRPWWESLAVTKGHGKKQAEGAGIGDGQHQRTSACRAGSGVRWIDRWPARSGQHLNKKHSRRCHVQRSAV